MKHCLVFASAARRIFNSLLGVSSGDEALHLMFDILRKQPPRKFEKVSYFVTSASTSPTHKKRQRRKIIHGILPVGRKDRSISRCFCRISCLCDFCGCSVGCCLTRYISLSLFGALQMGFLFFIPVCLQINCLHGYIKAQKESV